MCISQKFNKEHYDEEVKKLNQLTTIDCYNPIRKAFFSKHKNILLRKEINEFVLAELPIDFIYLFQLKESKDFKKRFDISFSWAFTQLIYAGYLTHLHKRGLYGIFKEDIHKILDCKKVRKDAGKKYKKAKKDYPKIFIKE